jgi:hypothetical protein
MTNINKVIMGDMYDHQPVEIHYGMFRITVTIKDKKHDKIGFCNLPKGHDITTAIIGALFDLRVKLEEKECT